MEGLLHGVPPLDSGPAALTIRAKLVTFQYCKGCTTLQEKAGAMQWHFG